MAIGVGLGQVTVLGCSCDEATRAVVAVGAD